MLCATQNDGCGNYMKLHRTPVC